MAYLFEDFQKFGKEHLEGMTTSSSSLAKSRLAICDRGKLARRWRKFFANDLWSWKPWKPQASRPRSPSAGLLMCASY